MAYLSINGNYFKNMLAGGAQALTENVNVVNELNVFPVPDGDTGYNMLKTLEGGIKKIVNLQDQTISRVISAFAEGSLLGARGNSGVILSMFFKGLAKGLEGVVELSVSDLKSALQTAVEYAYSAVEKPVEGTILTVFKDSATYANENAPEDVGIDGYLGILLESANKTLAKTKYMLPALTEADVVDSGGAGYVYILEGFIKALTGEEIAYTLGDLHEETEEIDLSLFTRDSVMEYGYCTEFILRLQTLKTNVDSFNVQTLIDYFKEIGGDSIVCVKSGDAVKVHVHTFTPGLVLSKCQEYGEFLTLKIENMTLQHNETKTSAPKKRVAVVAVANGNGVKDLFLELGADAIVEGGQTSNPSASDFIKAFNEVNAENIIVLPNNSNVILSACQASKMFESANVMVIPTKTIQQGYVSLSLINTSLDDLSAHVEEIKESLLEVTSIDVTYAVRNASINGKTILKGDYMAISSSDILSTDKDKVKTAVLAIKNAPDIDLKEIITVFIGKDVTETEKENFQEEVENAFPDHELVVYEGGQEVYSFLICIE
ncbi:MAG: DAK2 domain-containing protein [Clostridia bacterium]|nr:DAK2 domain-containing protein [Clostridia bacterium]